MEDELENDSDGRCVPVGALAAKLIVSKNVDDVSDTISGEPK